MEKKHATQTERKMYQDIPPIIKNTNTSNNQWRNGGVAVSGTPGTVNVTNCIVLDFDNYACLDSGSLIQSHNITSDGSAQGTGSQTDVSVSGQFVSIVSGSEDLHLTDTSVARNAGTNLYVHFTTDIDYGTRPETGNWDVGADQWGVAAAKRRKGKKPVDEVKLPKVFALHQNMPNPFNPITTIKYDVPYRKGRDNRYQTFLQIYDIRGKLITTLVDGIRRPGYYSIVWDGRNKQGKTLASGMYIYKFHSGNFIKKKKMILIK